VFKHQLKWNRDLAANIGICFYTPEEYFLGSEPEQFARGFEPTKFLKDPLNEKTAKPTEVGYKKINAQDIVLHCGSPGAGKSTFFWKKMEPLRYERVNQDILKTVSTKLNVSAGSVELPNVDKVQRQKCLKIAREHLATGRSVAVGKQATRTMDATYAAVMKLTLQKITRMPIPK